MKKALLGVVIVIAVVAVAAPFVNGLVMEKAVRGQVEKVNELYSDKVFGVRLEIARYERNFGSSEIEWLIKMPSMKMFEGLEDLVLIEKATHGYLGVTSETSLEQNHWFKTFVEEKLNGVNPLTISSCYSPLGGIESTVVLDRFELTEKEQTLVFSPAQLVVKTDMAMKNVVTSATFEGIAVPGELELSGISMESDIELITTAIMNGVSTVHVDKVVVNDEEMNVEIHQFNGGYTIDYDATDKTLSIATEYGAKKLMAMETVVDDIHIKVGVNQLDAEGFERLSDVYTRMMTDLMTLLPEAEENPEQMEAMVQQQMMLAGMQMVTEVESLLKEGLQVQVTDLHFHLPEGDIDGDFELGLKRDMTLAGFVALAQQPAELLNVFSMKSHVTLPEGLIDDQEKLLTPMAPGMPTGLFEVDGPKIVHQAEIKGNKLYLNGKEFALNF